MKTENEIKISVEDFKLIKQFYPEFSRKQGIKSNDFIIGWSELMPVVEKIEEVALNVVIETACVRIDCFDDAYPEYHSVTTFESQDDTKLKVLYRAIVACIRWYNSKNS